MPWGRSSLGSRGAQKVYDYFAKQLDNGTGNWTVTQSDPASPTLFFCHTRAKAITGKWWYFDRGGFNAFCANFDKPPKTAFLAVERTLAERPVCAAPG